MIIGDRVLEIDAKAKDRAALKGERNINIAISEIYEKNGERYYKYTYQVQYGKDGSAGYIKITGELIGKDEPKEILEKWKKEKKLTKAENERLLNTINYVGTAHSVIVARILNYPPALTLPSLRINEGKTKK